MNFIPRFATLCDMDSWMNLLHLVKDYFPGLDMAEYQKTLTTTIQQKEALVVESNNIIVGALIFSKKGEICFLAVHPEYHKKGIASILIQHLIDLKRIGETLYVITYRQGDTLGIGARNLYHKLEFQDAEYLTLFDYPCQKLIYTKKFHASKL